MYVYSGLLLALKTELSISWLIFPFFVNKVAVTSTLSRTGLDGSRSALMEIVAVGILPTNLKVFLVHSVEMMWYIRSARPGTQRNYKTIQIRNLSKTIYRCHHKFQLDTMPHMPRSRCISLKLKLHKWLTSKRVASANFGPFKVPNYANLRFKMS